MKKSSLLFLFIIIASLVSCDKTPELNDTVDGYLTLQVAFVYPDNARSNYSIVCNGDTVAGNSYLVSHANPSVTLEVFEKGKEEPDLSQELTLTESKTLQFIKLQGQPLAIYEADKYTTFSIGLSLMSGENPELYKILFDGQELTNKAVVYRRIDELDGTLKIQKEEQEVFSREITIVPGKQLSYVQLSDTDFLDIPVDEEPKPEGNKTKARFFYYDKDIPDASELEMTIYLSDRSYRVYDELTTIRIKEGDITDYILFDWDYVLSNGQVFRRIVYDLVNVVTGEKLADHTITPGQPGGSNVINAITNNYKKVTVKLVENGSLGNAVISEQ